MSVMDFEFGLNLPIDGLQELEEGVYFKHYGMDLTESGELQESMVSERFGEYEAKACFWQKQTEPLGESLALQAMFESLVQGTGVSQEQLRRDAIQQGRFQPGCGTSLEDIEELLKQSSDDAPIYVENRIGCTLAEIAEAVDTDGETLCYVSMLILDCEELQDYPGLNADGLVHVTGISFQDEEGDIVYINDVTKDDGAGRKIPLDVFLRAWSASDYRAIIVSRG